MNILDAIGLAIGTAAKSGADGGLALIIALIIVVSGSVAVIEAICGVFKRRKPVTLKAWIGEEVRAGRLAKDGTPLWCPRCKSHVRYRQDRRIMENNECVEFDAVCPDCGTTLGSWAYGHWNLP